MGSFKQRKKKIVLLKVITILTIVCIPSITINNPNTEIGATTNMTTTVIKKPLARNGKNQTRSNPYLITELLNHPNQINLT